MSTLVLDGEGCDVHEEKTMAYVRIVFMKVNEVDTVKEVYTAKAFIQVSLTVEPKKNEIEKKPHLCSHLHNF